MKRCRDRFTTIRNSAATCRYFYREVTAQRHSYPLILLLSVLAGAVSPFINIIVPPCIIDELMGGQEIKKLIVYVVVIVAGNYCFALLLRFMQETRAKQEDWFGRVFDLKMSEKSMQMKFENTEKENALEAEQKAETGMSWYSGGVRGMSDCVTGICSAALTFAGVVCLILQVSPWLLLVSVAAVCVNAFGTSRINQAAREVFEKTPAINKFYSYIYTKITFREYAKELRLYDGTELIGKKAVENAQQLNEMDNECAVRQFKWGIPGALASALGYGFSYCFLGILAIRRQVSIAEFVMCITAIETFTNGCLLPVINHTQQLVMKCNFMNAFIEFMGLEEEEQEGSDPVRREDVDGICFHHVSFRYPGAREYILRDINLTIRKGERLSIVGLNGAGKSTLVKLICRLYDVTEGEIRINGKNIKEYAYSDYVKILAVVFQDFKLFGYTIDENIGIGSINAGIGEDNGAGRELQKVYETSGIREWVESLEKKGNTVLCKDFDTEGVEPSGGQAEKVAIARALYRDAPVIILDEPTAALDPAAEYEIYHRFHELVQGKTAIYISHRLSSCKFCDRIIVLGDKRIKEAGSHDELMERGGLYAQMFRTQAQWYLADG